MSDRYMELAEQLRRGAKSTGPGWRIDSDVLREAAALLVDLGGRLEAATSWSDEVSDAVLRHRTLVNGCELTQVGPLPSLINQANRMLWEAVLPESEEEADYLTPKQYAAECRERCSNPAQGHDGSIECGGEYRTDQGEQAFAFCGFHWGPLMGVD